MVIAAESAGFDGGNFVKIQINGQNVDLEASEACNMEGLHIVVINKVNGDILCKKVFDVKISFEELDNFIKNIGMKLQDGSIIVAACKNECTNKMSMDAKIWFGDIGAREIWKKGHGKGFVFIGTIGNPENVNEVRSNHKKDPASTQQIIFV